MNTAGDHLLQNLGVAEEVFVWDELLHKEDRGTGWDLQLNLPTATSASDPTLPAHVGDSANIAHAKPLYLVVKDNIAAWEAIDAP